VRTILRERYIFMIKTIEDKAYETLKNLILDGELPEGEFLPQRKLAEMTGTAVATVRNSLRRLEAEGLIENIPKWGVRIPKVTAERIRDRYFVRELLEVGAVERIIEECSPKARTRLENFGRICDAVSRESKGAIKEFAEAHKNFHLAIAEFSHSPLLVDLLKQLNITNLMLWNAKYGWEKNKRTFPKLHYNLAKSIFDLNHDDSINAVREHIRNGMKNELEALENE
jgi:DNA-binding GntR family transcriptional regulator